MGGRCRVCISERRGTRIETKAVARVALIDSPSNAAVISCTVSPWCIATVSSLSVTSLSRLNLSLNPLLLGQWIPISFLFKFSISLSLSPSPSHLHCCTIYFLPATTVLRDSLDFETVHRERGISLVIGFLPTRPLLRLQVKRL